MAKKDDIGYSRMIRVPWSVTKVYRQQNHNFGTLPNLQKVIETGRMVQQETRKTSKQLQSEELNDDP